MKYQELLDGIESYEQRYVYEERIAPWSYLRTIEKFRDVRENLLARKLEDNALRLREVIKPFLIHWGKMARVVKRASDRDWETLALILWKLDAKGEFRKLMVKVGENMIFRELITINLDEEQRVANAVRTIHGRLQHVPHLGGSTCVTKILHIINPYIFAMWDSKIRRRYKAKNWLVSETSDGYLEFLKGVKGELEEAFNDYYLHAYMVKSYVELSDQEKLKVLERADWSCEWCGYKHGLCIAYVIPKSKGGSNELRNTRVLCVKCKLRKEYDCKTLVKLVDEYNWIKGKVM